MKVTKQSKEYYTPEFMLFSQNGQNRIFFAASGEPGPKFGASLSSIGGW